MQLARTAVRPDSLDSRRLMRDRTSLLVTILDHVRGIRVFSRVSAGLVFFFSLSSVGRKNCDFPTGSPYFLRFARIVLTFQDHNTLS